MKNNFKRILAMLLAVISVVGCVAFPVSATEPTVEQPGACEEHEWVFEKNVKATCKSQGYDLYYCPVCYRYEQRNVTDPAKHTWEPKGEVLPTCTNDGHPAGNVCSVCGAFDGTITDAYKAKPTCGANCDPAKNEHAMDPAKGCYHVWGPATTNGDPCKDKDATITYNCTEEGCKAQHVEKNNDGHKWEYTVNTKPTCEEATKDNKNLGLGSATRYCPVCKAEQDVVIERLAHDFEKSTAGSTDAKCGQTCKDCGKTQASGVDHVWGAKDPVVVNAQCGVDGSKTSTCTLCEYKKVEKIDALVHGVSNSGAHGKDEKVAEQALVHTKTQLTDHVITYKCAACKQEWNWTEEKAAHKLAEEIETIAPTCTLDGAAVGRCTCGIITTFTKDDDDAYAALGHTIDTTIDPDKTNYNCAEGGYYIYTCGREINGVKCGEKFNVTKEAGSHEKYDVTIPAECGTKGWKGQKCHLCSWSEGEDIPELQAHAKKTIVTFGKGCVDDIVKYEYCTNAGCDYNFDVTTLGSTVDEADKAALDVAAEANQVWKIVTPKKGSHQMTEEKVIIESTCHTTGWFGYECANCDLEIPTDPVAELNVNNHAYPEQQYLVNFRWTCSANGGEQRYSDIYCAVCHNIYSVKSVVAKDKGLDITVGSYYQFNPETNVYTLVDAATITDAQLAERGKLLSIKLYVEGVLKVDATELEITVDELKAATTDVVESGTGHVWFVTKEADCKDEGEKECALCSATAVISTTTAHVNPDDADKVETKPASCTEKGAWKGACKVCGTEVTGEYDMLAHTPVDDAEFKHLADDATCTANAKYYQICDVCDAKLDTKFEKADTMLDHVYDQEVTCTVTDCKHDNIATCTYIADSAISCIKKATYYKSCKCGASSKGVSGKEATFESGEFGECDKKPSAEKSYSAPANKVCVEYSYDVSEYCAVCDTVYTWTNYVAATGHEKAAGVWNPATCTVLGFISYACKHCGEYADADGEYFFAIETPAKTPDDKPNKNAPHINSFGEELTGNCKFVPTSPKALDVKDSSNGYYCVECKTVIAPDKHVWGAANACGVKTCTICESKSGTATHTFVKDTENSVDATTEADGKLVEVCTGCGETKTTKIGKLPVVTFSLEIANPNGGELVNGGKAYVTVKMNCIDANVNIVAIDLNVDKSMFTYVGKVNVDSYALGGDLVANQADNVVHIVAAANSEQKDVKLNGEVVLCVLEFNVAYNGIKNSAIENDLKKTEITFVEPIADIEKDPALMVLNFAGERIVFDVKTNNKLEITINQLGDANNDGIINSEDLFVIFNAVEAYNADPDNFEYNAVLDINKDGKITTADYGLVMQYMVGLKTYSQLTFNN